MPTAIFSYPNAGTDRDHEKARNAGLVEGLAYIVRDVVVHAWYTDVYLEGYYDPFNSVQFDYLDPAGHPVNIVDWALHNH